MADSKANQDKFFGKILLIGFFSLIAGFIVAFWIAGSDSQMMTLFVTMLLWIITTLLIVLVALVEDLNEDLKGVLKENLIEARETRKEISLLKALLKRRK